MTAEAWTLLYIIGLASLCFGYALGYRHGVRWGEYIGRKLERYRQITKNHEQDELACYRARREDRR